MNYPYNDCLVFGPYTRIDNRQHMIIIFGSGKRCTVSYPKYLLECHLKRYLTSDETVHHIDGNFKNNSIANLEIKNRSEHTILHNIHYLQTTEYKCLRCNKTITLTVKQQCTLKYNLKRNKKWPFCSAHCKNNYR